MFYRLYTTNYTETDTTSSENWAGMRNEPPIYIHLFKNRSYHVPTVLQFSDNLYSNNALFSYIT